MLKKTISKNQVNQLFTQKERHHYNLFEKGIRIIKKKIIGNFSK